MNRKEAERYGQASLFDSFQSEDYSEIILERKEEWQRQELLRHEKQYLGFFFSAHPLDNYRDMIKDYATLNTHQLSQTSSHPAPDRKHTIIGLLTDVKEIVTKTKRKMAFAKIEDFEGSLEIVIFSDVFDRDGEKLVNDAVVAVTGRIDYNRGMTKFIADEIVSPETLPHKRTCSIHIGISGEFQDDKHLMFLRDYLIEKRGECPLFLHIDGVVIKASSQLTVSDTEEVLEGLRAYPLVTEVWKEH